MSELKQGIIVNGEVISIKPFGAFVKIDSGETGLIHISQVSSRYIEKVEDALEVGGKVRAKVISVDDSGKISLSIKALEEKKPERRSFDRNKSSVGKKPVDFEDMMKKWMKSSEERLSALTAKQKKNR